MAEHSETRYARSGDRGVVVKQTGDGLLATFDGPGRAVRAGHRQGPGGRAGLEFADRGVTQLKGIPGEWRIFAPLG